MRVERNSKRALVAGIVAACAMAVWTDASRSAEGDSRDDANPWGLAPGAGTKFHPNWATAGIGWVRMFDEWGGIQPTRDQWKWDRVDKLVADARASNTHVTGIWLYFATWASADGGTRKGPIKDLQYWRDYVSASVQRYQKDIKYWEVWNEVNGSFYVGDNRVKDYAALVVAAYDAAKKIDPTAKIGMSVASSDIGFLDLVIKAGAAGHFDYICIHPYENMDAMMHGDEPGFLGLGNNLRLMLAANKQRADIPLWITEFGTGGHYSSPAEPSVKGYVLSLAQGFQRICWFGGVPAGLNTMIGLLGKEPRYIGWLKLGDDGYGFVFKGQEKGKDVLVAWAPVGMERKIKFETAVRVVDLANHESQLAAGEELNLTRRPVFVVGLPEPLVRQATEQVGKPFPWGGDYSKASEVKCELGETNVDKGLRQVFLRPDHENRSVPAIVDGEPCRRVVSNDKDKCFALFRADPRFIPFGPRTLDITVVARRVSPDKAAEVAITYENLEGYKDFKKGVEPWTIPAGEGCHKHTWRVTDACFANKWGWNIGLMSTGANPDLMIKEVSVTKPKSSAN